MAQTIRVNKPKGGVSVFPCFSSQILTRRHVSLDDHLSIPFQLVQGVRCRNDQRRKIRREDAKRK